VIRRFLPLAIFAVLAVLLLVGLGLNPRLVPSPLVGKPVPAFDVEQLITPTDRLTSSDLLGKVSLLNVWATWCVGCRQEHPLLLEIADSAMVPIIGLNYKDERSLAVEWLQRLGDPYLTSGFDPDGRVGLDFGVYGLPETFVVDPDGVIRYKHIGPLTRDAWERELLPVVQELSAAQGGKG
jgi:cytochrome c biogenesis protein CcmG/thiol:disulfide interchange protein DsbE